MKMISDFPHSITRKNYTEEEKKKLLSYMNDRKYLFGASTKRITDRITGESVSSVCFLLFEDKEYKWNSPEIYHLEKYDLALSDEFIQHVLGKNGSNEHFSAENAH